MSALTLKFFPRASVAELAEIETLVSVILFSGVGLLVSISIIVLDQYMPGEWF